MLPNDQTESPDPDYAKALADAPAVQISVPVIMLFQVFSLVVAAYMHRLMLESGVSEIRATHFGSLIGFAVLAVMLWPTLKENWPALKPLFGKPPSWTRLIFASMLLGVLLWLINTLVLIGIGVFQSLELADKSSKAGLYYSFACEPKFALLLAVVVSAVFTPIVEETVFRGLLLQSLLPKGTWIAILGSAFLFMILHKHTSYSAAFVFGLFMAVQLLHWRNVWSVVLSHSTANLLVVAQKTCSTKVFSPGAVTWEFGGNGQLSVAILTLSLGLAWWLAAICRTSDD